MKYIVLVADGMADYPLPELNGRTPLEAAHTPNLDFIVQHGRLGRVRTIPHDMPAGSDVANITILGYDTHKFYTGRGPLEAANLGIKLENNDVVFRCNLITAQGDILADYSAGHIKNNEAKTLIEFIDNKLGTPDLKFYPGVSYRHIMVAKDALNLGFEKLQCKAPHDITGKNISKNLPQGKNADIIIKLMQNSNKILPEHEINQIRIDLKENPANMIWLWGQGRKPEFPSFKEKFGLEGSIISAVDLLKGLGRTIGLEVINVSGATGYYDTNYQGKANAALKSLEEKDFVFLHVEAPDEAGHNGDLREKILAIERFDNLVVGTILKAYKRKKNFRILTLPDHATPISLKTHTSDIILFGIFGKEILGRGFKKYCEKESLYSDLLLENGHELMDYLLGRHKTLQLD